MSFSVYNKHFITIKLRVEMRNLSAEERKLKYVEIRDETRRRLKLAYSKTDDKIYFYKDTFEILQEFDAEFLLLNLLLDKDAHAIAGAVLSKPLLTAVVTSSPLFKHVILYLLERGYSNYNPRMELSILKEIFLIEIDGLSERNFDFENPRENQLIRAAARHIFTLVKKGGNIHDFYFSFLKLWNYLEKRDRHFNTKAIVFFSELNTLLNYELETVKGYIDFYNRSKDILKTLFIDIYYSPIHDLPNSPFFSNGHVNGGKLYFNRLHEIMEFYSLTSEAQYIDLIRRCSESEDEKLYKQCSLVLGDKVRSYDYPSSKEIDEILNLDIQNKNGQRLRSIVIKSLYIY